MGCALGVSTQLCPSLCGDSGDDAPKFRDEYLEGGFSAYSNSQVEPDFQVRYVQLRAPIAARSEEQYHPMKYARNYRRKQSSAEADSATSFLLADVGRSYASDSSLYVRTGFFRSSGRGRSWQSDITVTVPHFETLTRLTCLP
jgi:hypothetical protein